jgi:CRISPR-associated endonuclease/helicase Cas3
MIYIGDEMVKEFVAHYNEGKDLIQSVEEHLLNTAEMAEQITQKIGCEYIGEILGLFHDLGKYTDLFNRYIQSGIGLIKEEDWEYLSLKPGEGKIDHASAGAIKSWEIYESKILSSFISTFIIKCHHGGLRDVLGQDGLSEIDKLMLKTEENSRKKEAFSNFSSNNRLIEHLSEIDMDKMESDLQTVWQKILKFEKGKNSTHRSMAYFQLGLLVKYIYSALIDADRVDTADFQNLDRIDCRENRNIMNWNDASDAFELYIKAFKADTKIDKVRKEISDACMDKARSQRGIFKLQVPTGGGKTLSAMRFGLNHAKEHNLDHIIIIIPYTSIIDQNADVYRDIFEKKEGDNWSVDMVLEHHGNLTDDEKSETARILNENWDAPIIVTTMVQFLESVFSGGTSGIRRMHTMANSVLIFDEIQLLPPKTMVMFNGLIRFLTNICGSSIVLSTATQPLLDNLPGENSDYSLIIDKKNDIISNPIELSRKLKRVSVIDKRKLDKWSLEETIALIGDCNKKYGSTLVIVNTKKSATALYQELVKWTNVNIFHLSTNMCPEHRRATLFEMNNLLNDEVQRRQVVCISTQLIEAGIDVDFDVGIRYLAGMDSIVQAAGRINRHGLREEGILFIVNAIEKGIERLKPIKAGCNASKRLLDEFRSNAERYDNDLLSISAMDNYYKYYYHEIESNMQYTISQKADGTGNYHLFDLYGYNNWQRKIYRRQNKKFMEPFTMAFKTAGDQFSVIEGLQIGVIVPYGEGKDYIAEMSDNMFAFRFYQIKKQLQHYMINVYRNKVEQLIEEGVVKQLEIRLKGTANDESSTILYLDDNYYDDGLGYVTESIRKMYLID